MSTVSRWSDTVGRAKSISEVFGAGAPLIKMIEANEALGRLNYHLSFSHVKLIYSTSTSDILNLWVSRTADAVSVLILVSRSTRDENYFY